MSYEVDVLAVGDNSKSGDAIALRYGDFTDRSRHKVVVIDGGFADNGEQLVQLIRNTYGTTFVDLVISTHPDADHTAGLSVVLEQLEVGALWMHQPWNHGKAVAELRQGRFSQQRFYAELQKSIATASDLEDLANDKGIPITEPFEGLRSADGRLIVLGPSKDYYQELVAGFEDPAKDRSRSVATLVKQMLGKAVEKIQDMWSGEQLQEPEEGATRPQNNSSVILFAQLGNDDEVFLFTGDAGVPALDRAVTPERAEYIRPRLKYFQVPHHGSKRNIGPSALDRILGPRLSKGSVTGKTAFISAAKEGEPKHPSKRVVNAALRRGASVISTQGISHLYHSSDLGPRPGYGPLTPLSFTENFED